MTLEEITNRPEEYYGWGDDPAWGNINADREWLICQVERMLPVVEAARRLAGKRTSQLATRHAIIPALWDLDDALNALEQGAEW